MPRLTEARALRAPLPTGRDKYFLRCSEIRGFSVCISRGGSRTYCVEVTTLSKTKRITLGPVGVLSFDGSADAPGARDLALAAINANRRGDDAVETIGRKKAAKGITLNAVWSEYEKAGHPVLRGTGRKRASTVYADSKRWQKLVEKTLGKKPTADITTAVVQRWLDGIATEGQKSHALVLVKSILSFAGSRGLAEPHRIDIKAEKSKAMQNFYTPAELVALDAAAAALAAEEPHRVGVFSAIRLLLHTGCRASEIFSAKWSDIQVKRQVLRLDRDKTSKTGREVELSDAAIAILESLPRYNQWVFPSDSERGHLTTVQKAWPEVIERARVARHQLHDLRHSYASAAIGGGVSLYVVGQLLGHRQATTTQRYAHLERDAKREAARKVAGALVGPGDSPTIDTRIAR